MTSGGTASWKKSLVSSIIDINHLENSSFIWGLTEDAWSQLSVRYLSLCPGVFNQVYWRLKLQLFVSNRNVDFYLRSVT